MGTEEIYTRVLRADPDESRNYYDVLGVKIFENDSDRIHQAALLRFSDLNEQKNSNETPARELQEMYFELSCAATTLEVPHKKVEYDIKLAEKMGILTPKLKERPKEAPGQPPILKLDDNARKELEKAGKLYQDRVKTAQESHKEIKPIPRPNIIGGIPEPDFPQPHGEPKPKIPETKKTVLKKCPACNSEMSECAILCIECGYDIVKKDFVITKKLSSTILPPRKKGKNQFANSKELLSEGFKSFKNRTVAVLSYIVVALLIAIASILITKMVNERADFIIDAGNRTISSAWKDSFEKSPGWKKYFEDMKKSGRKAPYIKAEVKIGFNLDQYGFRHRYYDYSIIELYSGRITGSGHFNVSGGNNFDARIRLESMMIEEAVEKALPRNK